MGINTTIKKEKQNPCKHCDFNNFPRANEFGEGDISLVLFYDSENRKYYLSAEYTTDDVYGCAEITACPICGRKLEGELI